MRSETGNIKLGLIWKNIQTINLANLFTISRLVITPVLIYTILNDYYLVSGGLVAVAVASDWLDGVIARKQNDTTKHGELLDPAVDKIFTISVLVAFVEKQLISSFVVFLIVLREMMITWFRSVMVNKGVVVPASFHGKLKTTLQLIAIFLLLGLPAIVVFSFSAIILSLSYINAALSSLNSSQIG